MVPRLEGRRVPVAQVGPHGAGWEDQDVVERAALRLANVDGGMSKCVGSSPLTKHLWTVLLDLLMHDHGLDEVDALMPRREGALRRDCRIAREDRAGEVA